MEQLKDWWGVIMAAAAGLIWLVRLESRAATNTRDIDRLWNQRKEDMEAAKIAREETNHKIDKLEGKLEKAFGEIRADLRQLIQGRE